MKTSLCSILLLVAIATLSSAHILRAAGLNPVPFEPTAPPYCHPCLFYGGDLDPANALANGLENDQVLSTGGIYEIYVSFVVPQGQQWTVGSLFVNLLSRVSVIDPAKANYSISSGVSEGNAGTTITTATGPATFTPTGRSWDNYTEYTLLVQTHPTVLQAGTYWMSVLPRCTNPKDASCQTARYYLSDDEDDPPLNHFGPFEPANDSFFSSSVTGTFYGPTWGNNGVCGGLGCNRFSAGVIGTALKSGD